MVAHFYAPSVSHYIYLFDAFDLNSIHEDLLHLLIKIEEKTRKLFFSKSLLMSMLDVTKELIFGFKIELYQMYFINGQ